MSSLSSSYDDREPNIRKAKFVISKTRIYTLDFDHNLQMKELKLMIQKAAHLRKKNFRLFSNGEEYTQYEDEVFDNLFPHQTLVVFTLEIEQGEDNYETELLLQMNSPCSIHAEKFLLYYCFTCNTSVCSECFTNGSHKNHKIQDKCFYLLPSKYLVEKIFDGWSQNPYYDYKISVDLSDFKTKVNTVMFDELFNMLKKVQEKCNSLIDEYNRVNQTSLINVRDSVRDIKLSCIKTLDNLKDELDIKNIVNDNEIFVEFDGAYKELGKLQKDKFKQNLIVFQDLNNQISSLVSNLVQQIYSLIHKTLNDALNEQQYDNIKYQISQKFIKPIDKNEILFQLSEHKKKKRSYMSNNSSANRFVKNIALGVNEKFKSDQGKSNSNITSFNKNLVNEFNLQEKNVNPTQISSINQIIRFPNIEGNTDLKVISSSYSNNNDNQKFIKPENTLSTNALNNIKNNDLNYGQNQNIRLSGDSGPFSSAHTTRQVMNTNIIPNINLQSNSNLFSATTNREVIPINKTQVITTTIQETKTFENNINQNQNNINNNVILSYINNNNSAFNNVGKYINNQRNIIREEYAEKFTESETDIRRPTDIRRFLNSQYILAPVSQTYSIKLVTSDNSEERTVPLKFPENFGFNTFFLDCAYCNCDLNKCLYVCGGIESNSKQKRSSSLLCIDITKPDDLKVTKKASMNYGRCGHTMVSEGKYIYVCGGEDSNSVERYDIENDIWEILPNMICKRMYPILYVYNGYLYAFLGKNGKNEYPCSVERLNISGNSNIVKPCWEMVIFSNRKNINLNYYGCALHEIGGILYFFGGKCNEQSTNKIFLYNFEKRFFETEDSSVTWTEYFRENKLHQINDAFVQVSETKSYGVYLRFGFDK